MKIEGIKGQWNFKKGPKGTFNRNYCEENVHHKISRSPVPRKPNGFDLKMYLDTEEKSIDEDSKYQTTEESTAETEEIEDSQISES